MKKRRSIAIQLVVLVTVVLVGCGHGTDTGSSGTPSSWRVRWHSQVYDELEVQIAPPEGSPLGSYWRYIPRDSARPAEQMFIPLARFRGLSPEIALVWRGRHNVVFVRHGIDRPQKVAGLLHARGCDEAAAPLKLFGPWLSINIPPASHTSTMRYADGSLIPLIRDYYANGDPIPPYDVYLLVERSSQPGYENAFLTVHVPKGLGRPLSGTDLGVQGNGATINIVARCEGSGFVAQRVRRNTTFTSRIVTYRGHKYQGVWVHVARPEGAALGSAEVSYLGGFYRERVHIARLAGTSSDAALVQKDRPEMVFVRKGTSLPPEIVARLHAPGCRKEDAPIQMLGRWNSSIPLENMKGAIPGSSDLIFLVRNASSPVYENAFLTVEIPGTLGFEQDGEDEGTGGVVKVVTRCRGSRFVARQVRTEPPLRINVGGQKLTVW